MSYDTLSATIRYGFEIRAYLGEFRTGGSLVAVMAHKRIQNFGRTKRRKSIWIRLPVHQSKDAHQDKHPLPGCACIETVLVVVIHWEVESFPRLVAVRSLFKKFHPLRRRHGQFVPFSADPVCKLLCFVFSHPIWTGSPDVTSWLVLH
jgi:hypothetical protein